MDFRKELEIMRENYRRKPLKIKKLPRPRWLTEEDGINLLYKEKDILFEQGQVYYACIVVSFNKDLYNPEIREDGITYAVYSADEAANNNPTLLEAPSINIYRLKDRKAMDIPPRMAELAASLKGEHGHSAFAFAAELKDGTVLDMRLVPLLIFRKMLPAISPFFSRKSRRCLKLHIVPILAAPGVCSSAIILPEKYWSKKFRWICK